MAVNKLGIGKISLPFGIDNDLKIAIEELVSRANDNVDYLLKPSIRSSSSDEEATDLDSVVLSDATDGAKTITLPKASQARGKQLKFKKTDSSGNSVSIAGSSGETIDGGASYALATQHKYVAVVSDGEKWHIVSNN